MQSNKLIKCKFKYFIKILPFGHGDKDRIALSIISLKRNIYITANFYSSSKVTLELQLITCKYFITL